MKILSNTEEGEGNGMEEVLSHLNEHFTFNSEEEELVLSCASIEDLWDTIRDVTVLCYMASKSRESCVSEAMGGDVAISIGDAWDDAHEWTGRGEEKEIVGDFLRNVLRNSVDRDEVIDGFSDALGLDDPEEDEG